MMSIFDLWPEEGQRCIVSIRNKKTDHHWVSDGTEAEAKAQELDDAGCDVYFAPATYSMPSRKQAAVSSVQSLWVDIDCGEGKPYAGVPEGVTALHERVSAEQLLKPSAIVQSGHGLHAYWKLIEPVSSERWEPLAKAFKAYLISIGLKIDPVCTADGARIMRVPGTHNRKAEPVLTKVTFSDAVYSLVDFAGLTSGFEKPPTGKPSKSLWTAGIEPEFPPARIEPIEEGCAQMAYVKEEGGAVSEPFWRAALSILWRCEGGVGLIHEWSGGDPRYDPKETRAKAEGTQGPYTCQIFAEVGSNEKCENCPHKGKVKSPIVLGQPSLSPAPAVALDGEVMPPLDSCSDIALATVFTRRFGDILRFVAPWGTWLIWDGRRWRKEQTFLVKDHARRVCEAVALKANSKSIGSRRTVEAVEVLAKADRQHAATVDQWDSDHLAINTPGGILDLKDQPVLVPHESERYMTRMTAVVPDFETATPHWDTFLHRVLGGDGELVTFLQRMSGYFLTGDTGEHALFFLYGTGANGKSVFVETIAGILSDYRANAPVDVFLSSRGDRHPAEIAMMNGPRLVTATETPEGRRWDDAKIKALTGGDTITARFMRQDFFEFKPQFKLMISGNHKPGLRSVDEAMRRRIHLIPFAVTIPEAERDPRLPEKLKQEWPGILAWMVRGFAEWRRIGLAPPVSVKAASDEYLEDEDTFGQWVEEWLEADPCDFTGTNTLFANWQLHCTRTGEFSGKERQFSEKLKSRGFEPHRTNSARGFKVILKPMQTMNALAG